MNRFSDAQTLGEILADPAFAPIRDDFFYRDGRAERRLGTPLKVLHETEDRSAAFELGNFEVMADMLERGLLRKAEIRAGVNYFSFLVPEKGRPFYIVIPGGAYEFSSHPGEGFRVALTLNKAGCNAFVVDYGVMEEAEYPQPVNDVANALRMILKDAKSLNIDGNAFGMIGFSAGGHLASICCAKELGLRSMGLPNPDTLLLGYPVITFGEYAHERSRELFLGRSAGDMAKRKLMSAENNIDEAYPSTYICAANHDVTVDYHNFLLMDEALKKAGVPHHLRLEEETEHGFGCGDQKVAPGWILTALEWRKGLKR